MLNQAARLRAVFFSTERRVCLIILSHEAGKNLQVTCNGIGYYQLQRKL